jgi:hypothetical protein
MMTAGAPPRGDDDMPDHPATQPGAVYDGENNSAPMLTARHGSGLPGSYTDTLDQLHRVPVWPGPQPPTAKALRRRRIREALPEVGIVTLVLVVLGGLLAAAVLTTATGAVYDHARHHGAVITKTAGRPAPRPGAGVTPAEQPGPALGSYLVPRMVPAAPSPSRVPVPASRLPGTPGTSPGASTVPPRSSPATPPTTVTTTPPGSPPPASASPTPPPASTPAPTPTTTAPTPTTTASPPTTTASPSPALTDARPAPAPLTEGN